MRSVGAAAAEAGPTEAAAARLLPATDADREAIGAEATRRELRDIIAGLEALLRRRDAEIAQLREEVRERDLLIEALVEEEQGSPAAGGVHSLPDPSAPPWPRTPTPEP